MTKSQVCVRWFDACARYLEKDYILYVIFINHKRYYLQNFDYLTEIIAESLGDIFVEERKLNGKKREHAGVGFE